MMQLDNPSILWNKKWYVDQSNGYARYTCKVRGKNKYIHHLVLGKKPGWQIDHINQDKLDNRRCNLRYVKPQQNIWNIRRRRHNTTGVTGVVISKGGRFTAQCNMKGKHYCMGTFDKIDDAKQAYETFCRDRPINNLHS